MNKIIEFLQNQSRSDGELLKNRIDKQKLLKSFLDLSNKIGIIKSEIKRTAKLKHSLRKGQIWLCKQEYFDVLGNQIIGNMPFLVLIVSNVESICNEDFVRIQPISPFTEFKAEDDIIINDDSIIGFEFIVETWNEQPILTEILEEYVGELDNCEIMFDETEVDLFNNQKEFRKAEIRNTEYLRQSIISLIKYEELKEKNSVFLNIYNTLHFAESDNKETKLDLVKEPEQAYLQLIKKDELKESSTYLFNKTINDVNIEVKVIKENKTYIIAIKQNLSVEMRDSNFNLLKQSSLNFYDNLKSGLYFASFKEINSEIRIKLI